jgi:hypothetical protein
VSVPGDPDWGPTTLPAASGEKEGVVAGAKGKEPVSAGEGWAGANGKEPVSAEPGWAGVIAGEKAVKDLKVKESG